MRSRIKSGKKRELDELTAGGTGQMARGQGACAQSLPELKNINFPHGSGPTFIRPPKIQKEEHTRQV